MLDWLSNWLALRKWKKSDIGVALKHHCYSYLTAPNAPLGWMSDNAKQEQTQYIHQKFVDISTAANPFMAAREELCNHSILFAQFASIALTEDEKSVHEIYQDTPYISGQLHHHVEQIVEHFEELQRFKFDEPDATAEDLITFCNARSAILLFHCNGLNMIRMFIEGKESYDQDWFRAMIQALMVGEEDRWREHIGLPRLLPNTLDGLKYRMFFNQVMTDEPNPLFLWCKTWPDLYLYGHGPRP